MARMEIQVETRTRYMIGWRRITKAEWSQLGGLRNSDLCRVERGGRWNYFRRVD